MIVIHRTIEKALAPLKRRISQMLVRALVTSVNEEVKRQTLQVKVRADESADDIERFQNYGVSSNPPLNSEAILAALGGNLSQLVAIAVENKDYRPKGEMGDVFLYHMDGHRIQLGANGSINITANRVNLTATDEFNIVSPAIHFKGVTHFEGDTGFTGETNFNNAVTILQTGDIASSASAVFAGVVDASNI